MRERQDEPLGDELIGTIQPAPLDTLLGESQGLGVVGEGLGRAPMDVAGELVQEDQQRQRSVQAIAPMIQGASGGGLDGGHEPFADFGIELRAARILAREPDFP